MELSIGKALPPTNESLLIVDRLGVSTLFVILWRFKKIRSIHYLHRTKSILGSFLTRLLKGMGWSFQSIDCTLSESNGACSLYEELNQILISERKIVEDFLLSHFTNKVGDISEYERARLATCFSKYAAADLYFALQLYVILLHKFPYKNRIKAVLLKKGPFSHRIREIYASVRLPLLFYNANYPEQIEKRKNYLWDREISYYKLEKKPLFLFLHWVGFFLYLILSLVLKLISFVWFPKGKKIKYRICAWIFNHRATDSHNCLPWVLQGDDSLKNQILALHLPLRKSARDFYQNRSSQLIEIVSHHFFSKIENPLFFQSQIPFPGMLLKNIRTYRRLFGLRGIHFWISKYLIHFLMKLSFFEALFLTTGSKILWTMNEDDSQTQIAAVAIRRFGGVSLETSWSQPPFPSWDQNQNDIFFCWGKRMVEISMATAAQCHSYVISGYPAEEIFGSELRKALELRETILNNNPCKKIVVFFDNIAANDTLISGDTLLETYQELLSWLGSQADNFLIIKSKKMFNRDDYPDLSEKIEMFQHQDRLLFIYGKGALYPGLAADLVFSLGSISLSSLSALLGKPVIIYDKHRYFERYPLILPNLTLIHKSNKIYRAIETTLEKKQQSESFTKLEPFKGSHIDPFMDGQSASRIHHYIYDLLNVLNREIPPSQAIAFANERYKKRWGEEMVISGPLRRLDTGASTPH